MRYFVARNNKLFLVCLVCFGIIAPALVTTTPVGAQSSSVYATLCGATSHVSITQPVSDSTVAQSAVTLQGNVTQANQIEVYVDGEFDSTIPLTIGQSSYSGSIQLPTGTHTIRVEAINSCSGQNGDATSVVTYTPPPAQGSTGQTTPTQVVPSSGGVVTVDSTSRAAGEGVPQQSNLPLGLPPVIGAPLMQSLEWLGITHSDTADGVHGLSVWRAVFVVSGMYLVVLGAAPFVIHYVAQTTIFTAMTSQATTIRRRQLAQWTFRGVGLVILLLALFL